MGMGVPLAGSTRSTNMVFCASTGWLRTQPRNALTPPAS